VRGGVAGWRACVGTGSPQARPKRLRFVLDVSGSMYRFNSEVREVPGPEYDACDGREAREEKYRGEAFRLVDGNGS
jgi:hypothetical protein